MSIANNCVFRIGVVVLSATVMFPGSATASQGGGERIRPYSENPYYWQYKGKPVLLLGGSWQDNLFNHPIGLERHLDLLKSVGGNYVRNVMSHRNEGNVFAYERVDGKFDLDRWNEEYWRRLEDFLRMTHARDIFVQIEIFDRHDLSADHQSYGGWSKHPFNPANNSTWSPEESRLPTAITSTPGRGHPFFTAVPALKNNELVLRYQRAYVDKLLSVSLKYGHVLYCIQNESSQELEFGDYWAEHILGRAREAGRVVFLTDMRNNWDISHSDHHHIYDNPDRFNFLDVSQNSWQSGQIHYDRIVHVRRHIGGRPRPINTTKIYNRDGDEESVARMFRIIFAGGAGARFHRPHPLEGTGDHEKTSEYGLGLSPRAQAVLRSARMLTDAMNVFACEPNNDLLGDRSPNEAYCLAEPGRQYAVYFPDGGAVRLDVSAVKEALEVSWLDITRSEWRPKQRAQGGGILELNAPGKGHWAVLVRSAAVADRVGPCPKNPHYLAWGHTPVFPLGATGYHSWTPISRPGEVDFEAQMDRLAAVIDEIGSPHVCGFVRCLPYDPMNHMHDGPVKEVLQPWAKLADGRYDLKRFEPAWEKRLREYLAAALKRRIVVSLEVWDDWSVTRGPGGAYDPGAGAGWNAHPFNPRNNVNYDEDILPATTTVCNAPFYSTIPSRRNNETVLDLQKHYVDRLLAIASDYPNIMLSIANESRAHMEWSRFWAEYVRQRAPSGIMIGEMPSTNRKDGGGECEHAFNPLTLCTDPLYDYVDVAQGVSGHEFRSAQDQALGGGRRIAEYRRAMAEAGTRRPLVVSKDYTRGPDGGDMVLWGRFVGGAATARFHRLAGNHPESVSRFQHEAVGRLGRFIAQAPFWRMHPSPDLVAGLPVGAGANVLAEPAGHCVVQLIGATEGGSISLNLSSGKWLVRWIDPASGRELARSQAVADATGLKLDIAGQWNHCIIHLAPRREP